MPHVMQELVLVKAFAAEAEGGPQGSATIEATNVTAIGDGSAGQVGIRDAARQNTAPMHADATVLLRNSILLGFKTPISRSGEAGSSGHNSGIANVALISTLSDPLQPVESGPGGITRIADPGPVDPHFVGPGDFHLLGDSPLIDVGDPSGLPATDLDGAARSLDGNGDGTAVPDIGAYERAVPSPPAAVPSPPGPSPDTTAPRLSKLSLSHSRFQVGAKATAFRFALSEPATVTIAIERPAGGKVRARGKRWLKAGPPLRRPGLAAGPRSVPFGGRVGRHALGAGHYRATLVASDAAGNHSALHRVGFRILP